MAGFQFWINRFLEDGAYPFMTPILKNFVLAHATPLAFFVAYGELAIGVSLFRESGASSQFFRIVFHAESAFFFQLTGNDAPFWAILWSIADHSVLALCFLAFLIGHAEAKLSVSNLRRNSGKLLRFCRPRGTDLVGGGKNGECETKRLGFRLGTAVCARRRRLHDKISSALPICSPGR